jgi:alkylated DNA nucleotide flippase Atl1
MSEQSLPGDDLPEYAERVLGVVDLVPPGRVMTYGDIAEWLEHEEGEREALSGKGGGGRRVGGPRQVGRVMARYGGTVPWWRVIRADGVPLPGQERQALGHYRSEGTPLREAGRAPEADTPRVDMERARWGGGERPGEHT